MMGPDFDLSWLRDDVSRKGDRPERSLLDVVRDAIASIPPSQYLREDHVAKRMTQERERRDWSQERLSREMKRHGFSLSASSISKIENPPHGTTRRAVTLDQAVGLATVFEMPLLELLSPPSPYGSRAVEDMVAGADLAEQAEDSRHAFDAAVRRVAQEFANHPDEFGPMLAREAKRLLETGGVELVNNGSVLEADVDAFEGPARYQLIFLQAALRELEDIKPRTRGTRKRST